MLRLQTAKLPAAALAICQGYAMKFHAGRKIYATAQQLSCFAVLS